jgi:twitching motility protein PilT
MPLVLTEQDTYFGTIAYRNKLITAEQLQEGVLIVQKTPGKRLGDILVQKGYITQEQVDSILGIQSAQRQILGKQAPPPSPTPPLPEIKPEAPAQPVEPEPEETLKPAEAEPAKEPLSSVPGTAVAGKKPAPAGKSPLGAPIGELKAAPEKPVAAAPKPAAKPGAAPAAAGPKVPEKLEHLVDYLAYARAAGASDLHISAEVKPFMRLHGRVVEMDVPVLRPSDTERLLFAVLSTQQKAILLEKRGLEFCYDAPGHARYRSCIFKERCGWDGNFHVIREKVPSFAEIGLPECLKRLTEYNQGLVLVTGPSNSGKTTTLAALIDMVNRTRDDHIITVEKPVEYLHTPVKCQVTQREVGSHTSSFATALRAALREDPDIIMVGELRDLETLSIAITASETGHLVFGTLPTTSAVNTVNRIVDGFPVGQQGQIRMMLSESLRGVISQQLIPRKDGKGVALALEILFITPAIGALIRDNQPHQIQSTIQTSRKIGMCRFDDSLMELVKKEIISGAEAYRRADNKGPFEQFKDK